MPLLMKKLRFPRQVVSPRAPGDRDTLLVLREPDPQSRLFSTPRFGMDWVWECERLVGPTETEAVEVITCKSKDRMRRT